MSDRKLYVGIDAAEHKYVEKTKEMAFTSEDKQKFVNATECHICGGRYPVGEKKTRDHCDILEHFLGAAHNKCNLNYKIDYRRCKLPIFFNLRGYDGQLLIKAVKYIHGNVRVVPNNMERYMIFPIGRLHFLDSFRFTMQSLVKLVTTLDSTELNTPGKNFQMTNSFI